MTKKGINTKAGVPAERARVTGLIMEMLAVVYTDQSVIYGRVARSLNKFSLAELDALYTMVWTATAREERKARS